MMLHGYRQFHILHRNRRHLNSYCKRCWNKIWYFKTWIRLIRLMKDHLGGKIMAEFAALRRKTYSYLTNDNDGNKMYKNVCHKIKSCNWNTI